MRKITFISLMVGASLLTACGGDVGEVLGLNKEAPDEFRVVTRAPLSVPPGWELRPPDPNAKRANEISVREEAKALLLGTQRKQKLESESRENFRGSDLALLTKADALSADPAIRRVVDQESTRLAIESDSFVQGLMFWKDKEAPGTIVDAAAETQRLQENAGLGKPVTEGDTPMIRREKNDSVLNKFKWPFSD